MDKYRVVWVRYIFESGASIRYSQISVFYSAAAEEADSWHLFKVFN